MEELAEDFRKKMKKQYRACCTGSIWQNSWTM